MEKTIIDPGTGNELVADSDAVDETAYSRGVVVEHPTHCRVFVSGVTAGEHADESVADQTRVVLETIQGILSAHDGGMNDIVRVRVYVDDVVDTEFDRVHEVRNEFFDRDHFPASTLVEVDQILRGNIEIDAEAVIPDDGWDVKMTADPTS